MGSEDTHAVVGGLVRRCGGEVVASVAKGSTGLLIVGRGEKGENGKPDGKGGRAGLKRRLSFGGCSTAPARLVSLTGRARLAPPERSLGCLAANGSTVQPQGQASGVQPPSKPSAKTRHAPP